MKSIYRRLPALLFVLAVGALATMVWAASDTPNAPDAPAAPAAGTAAPDFSLVSNEGKPTSLKDFHGKWVVLYFYPKDFTGGCTLEAHNFQRDLAMYEKAGAVIVGVSIDDTESHKGFCAKEGLTFKLLSDPDAKVSEEYGSVMSYMGHKLSARHTFLVDPEGKIAKVYLEVNPANHSEEVLAALGGLQGGPKS